MSKEIIGLISSIGAIQSFFLAIYVLSIKGRMQLSNLFLGLLFVALAIRVGKSVLWAYWEQTPLWLLNLGFGAHAAVGPLFLVYIYHITHHEAKFQKTNYLHFLLSIAIIVLSSYLPLTGFWYSGGYSFLLFHQLTYMLISLIFIGMKFKNGSLILDNAKLKWLLNLWLGITIWGLAYFSNYILGITSYLLGPMLYSGIIYFLSYYGFKNQNVFHLMKLGKYKNLNLTKEDTERYRSKLLKLIEEEKPYLDVDFSLTMLSKMVFIPGHILSHIINDELKSNFSEFINTYRVKNAQLMLHNPSTRHQKISSIAYESGFNSLSSFNTAFKRVVQMTPSDFRNQQS